jgi:hypothetical protein
MPRSGPTGYFRPRSVFTQGMRLAVLVCLIMAVGCVDASASTYRLLDAQGDPQLVVYAGGYGGSGWVDWTTCPGNGAPCFAARPWQTSAGTGSGESFSPGPTSAGSVFRGDGSWEGQPVAFRATWLGTVTSVAPPVLRGRAIVGTQVMATPGTWSGGWGDELSALRVQACRTRDARDCESLTTGNRTSGEPMQSTPTVTEKYAGWYLFAVDLRREREFVPYPMPAILSIGPLPPVEPGPTVAFSAPVGPVIGPTAVLRRRALYRHGRPLLGKLRCPVVRCTAAVRVRRGAVTRTRTLHVTGSAAIAPRLRLRAGVWRVTVAIDGGPAVQRRVRVRRSS